MDPEELEKLDPNPEARIDQVDCITVGSCSILGKVNRKFLVGSVPIGGLAGASFMQTV